MSQVMQENQIQKIKMTKRIKKIGENDKQIPYWINWYNTRIRRREPPFFQMTTEEIYIQVLDK